MQCNVIVCTSAWIHRKSLKILEWNDLECAWWSIYIYMYVYIGVSMNTISIVLCEFLIRWANLWIYLLNYTNTWVSGLWASPDMFGRFSNSACSTVLLFVANECYVLVSVKKQKQRHCTMCFWHKTKCHVPVCFQKGLYFFCYWG